MSRVCAVSGKRPLSGHHVSHSNRRTKRRFLTNSHAHRIWIPSQRRFIKLKITAYGVRLIDKLGIEKALAKFAKSSVY